MPGLSTSGVRYRAGMTDHDLPDHVVANRAFWTTEAAAYVAPGRRNWAAAEPSWGI